MAGMRRHLQLALNLPSFLLAYWLMYWSFVLGVMLNKIKIWKLRGSRNDAYGWANALQTLFGIKVLQLPGPKLYRSPTACIYLSNHRSWADFFIEVLTTHGDAQMLSRWAVYFVFPMFMQAVVFIRSVVLFKRGAIYDKDKFNAFIDAKLAASPVSGLIVYPEGHRSTKPKSLPLKRGMLHYVYSRGHPVQIIITANKEAVISEKTLSAHFGQTVLAGYAEPIQSKEFGTFEEFFQSVETSWDAEWRRVYEFDWADAQPFEGGSLDGCMYPSTIKGLMILVVAITLPIFFASLYLTWLAAAWVLGLFGSYQSYIVATVATWVGTSLWQALQPVVADAAITQPDTAAKRIAGRLHGAAAKQRSAANLNGAVPDFTPAS